MTMTRLLLIPALFAALAAAILPAAAETSPVGVVQLVKVWAYERKPPEDWNELLLRENVYTDQWLRTVPEGALHVRFVDGTQLRLGADSQMVVDRYVYDPNKGDEVFVSRLAKGMFRFISGNLQSRDVRVDTPTLVLGIRGTDFIVKVGPKTVVQVVSGSVVVTPKTPGASSTVLTAGEVAAVGPGDTAASPAAEPGFDYGLSGDGGVDASGAGLGGGGGASSGDGGVDGGDSGGGGKR